MRKFLIIFIIINLACSSASKEQILKLEGKFIAVNSENLIVELKQVGDSLFGHHCFISKNGNRIDCCYGTNNTSIRLRIESSGVYKGTLKDCYDEDTHDIEIMVKGKGFILKFTKKSHPFVADSLTFIEDTKKSRN